MTTADGLNHAWRRLREEAKKVYPPICCRCEMDINMDLPPRHKWSWSLDHLDARATYGNAIPTIDRVRPAHYGCNSRAGGHNTKGARTDTPIPHYGTLRPDGTIRPQSRQWFADTLVDGVAGVVEHDPRERRRDDDDD